MNCLLLCRALLDSVGGLCGIQSMILFCLDVYALRSVFFLFGIQLTKSAWLLESNRVQLESTELLVFRIFFSLFVLNFVVSFIGIEYHFLKNSVGKVYF